jgi:hypothetical protein
MLSVFFKREAVRGTCAKHSKHYSLYRAQDGTGVLGSEVLTEILLRTPVATRTKGGQLLVGYSGGITESLERGFAIGELVTEGG